MKEDIEKYVLGRINNLDDFITEDDIYNITEDIKTKFSVPCDYFHAGEFDSPGYDCDYFNIVWFVDGNLEATDIQCERY